MILVAGALLATGLIASLVAFRVRVPSLVLFLGLGMLVGSDVIGWIEFDDYELARTIGVIALSLILFEGGLAAGLNTLRPVLAPAISLALVGTMVTALVAGVAAAALFGYSLEEGLLVGAILSATDGAAVFALLRGSALRRRLGLSLEGESGFNDPIAVLLVLGFVEVLQEPGYGVVDFVGLFAQQISIGLAVGVVVGLLAVAGFRRARLATPGLYPVASLATVALAYGAADSLHGSGFLAVYVAALLLGSATVPAARTVAAFHEGIGWVAQLTLFLTLGLLVFPTQLDDVALEGIVLALVLVFVARPLAAAIATLGFGFDLREKALLAWAGLRGAVPVVLATFPVIAGVEHSVEFFNIVFFAVLISTVLQGSTVEPLAERLGVTSHEPVLPRPLSEAGTTRRLGAEVLEYTVGADDAVAGARVRDLGLPRDAVVNVIVRGDQAIPPRGSTRINAGDELHLLLRAEAADRVRRIVDGWRSGRLGPPPRPKRRVHGRQSVFTSWRWGDDDGDPAAPDQIKGLRIVEQLRIRRDHPGGLWVLEDGRYAVSGRLGAVGSRRDLTDWCRRRMRHAGGDERAWLQTVIGALAADLPDRD